MKKSVIFSMLFLVGLALGVVAAPGFHAKKYEITKDSGTSTIVKQFESNDLAPFAAPVAALPFEEAFSPVILAIPAPNKAPKLCAGYVKERIYLLNCSIRQC
jgi:hypothetical protein